MVYSTFRGSQKGGLLKQISKDYYYDINKKIVYYNPQNTNRFIKVEITYDISAEIAIYENQKSKTKYNLEEEIKRLQKEREKLFKPKT